MSAVTPSSLVSQSEKSPKIYFQGKDFEMNFIPHIVLFLFTIDGSDFFYIKYLNKTFFLSVFNIALNELNGNDSNSSEERKGISWIENAQLVNPKKGKQ